MSRLRIYSGGTGNLQYDSKDSTQDQKSAKAQQEFNAGVLLLYAPDIGEFHSYVKLHRRAEEQFLAVYENETGDLVAGFNSAIKKAVNERDWKVVSANQVNQSVFENLGTKKHTEPNVDITEIKQEIEQQGTIDFTAGSARTAVQLFEYLRQNLPTLSIAITTGGRSNPVDNINVVIKIDNSYKHSQPTVGTDTAKRLHNAQIKADKEALQEQISQLGKTLNTPTRAILGQRIAESINAVDIKEKYGVLLQGKQDPVAKRELAFRYAISSFSIIFIIGFLLLIRIATQGTTLALGQPVTPPLPVATAPVTTRPAWQFLLIEIVLFALILFPFRRIRQSISYLLSPLLTTIAPNEPKSGSSDQAYTVLDQIEQLKSRTTSEDRFKRELKDIFSQYGVTVTPEKTARRNRIGQRLLGLVIGVTAGGSLAVLVKAIYPRLFSAIDQYIEWILLAILVGIIITMITRVFIWLISPKPDKLQKNSHTPSYTNPQSDNKSPPVNDRPSQSLSTRDKHHSSTTSGENRNSESDNHRLETKDTTTTDPKHGGKTTATRPGGSKYEDTIDKSKLSNRDQEPTSSEENTTTSSSDNEENTVQNKEETNSWERDSNESSVKIEPSEQNRSEGTKNTSKSSFDTQQGDFTELNETNTEGLDHEFSLEYKGPENVDPSGSEFRTHRFDNVNTGHHPGVDEIITSSPVSKRTEQITKSECTPPVITKGNILIGLKTGHLIGLVIGPTEPKKHKLHSGFISPPTVTETSIYTGDVDGKILSVSQDGLEPIWEQKLDGAIKASVKVGDEILIVVTVRGEIQALRPDTGEQIWEHSLTSGIMPAPALSVSAKQLYVGTQDGDVVALSLGSGPGGREIWTRHLDAPVNSSPTAIDDVVYMGCGNIFELNAATGSINWRKNTHDFVEASPAVAGQTLFIGDTGGKFYALERSSGTELWSTKLGSSIRSPATIAGKYVFVGDEDGNLHSLDARTGEQVWTYEEASGAIRGNPVVINEYICFTTSSNEIHLLEQESRTDSFT